MLLRLMHENARFVLHQTHSDAPLPHAKEIRVQCGGLRGLAALLNPDDASNDALSPENAHALIHLARQRFDDLRSLPFQDIVMHISRWQGRRRGGRTPQH